MRIAQIAPLYEAVPPRLYGGTERIVASRLRLTNFGSTAATVPLRIAFAADFVDMFEVRGMTRSARGKVMPVETARDRAVLRYTGLDDRAREASISFSQMPDALSETTAEFSLTLKRSESADLYVEIGAPTEEAPSVQRYRSAAARARWDMRRRRRQGATLRSSGPIFNSWLERSRADLALLTTDLPTGPYPYAGIPWFSTAFGTSASSSAFRPHRAAFDTTATSRSIFVEA
jgi:glycogen debranching enzyme